MEMTEVQKKIIEQSGNLIVSASAGTGKTHTMVIKIEKELKQNTSHKVIAAITFTVMAAIEIQERLTIDTTHQFIGTNNSFAIKEIIKPFMKDVYGDDYNIDMSTDYSKKIGDFSEGKRLLKTSHVLGSYENNKQNFIFELALKIVKESQACQLYLKSKYFKIYIDEYQDCDKDMHNLFMYLCENLNIDTFIVGDEKQSIYMWRGAHPEAFRSILIKPNFKKVHMIDNFRSCKQIQNYSNLLCEDTRHLYEKTNNLNNIFFVSSKSINLWSKVQELLDPSLTSALLRYRNSEAEQGAQNLSNKKLNYVFIPRVPISDITTEDFWLYNSIASYCILNKYSVYNLINEQPVELIDSDISIRTLKEKLKKINHSIKNKHKFQKYVCEIFVLLGYEPKAKNIEKLYDTIINNKYHVAFDPGSYMHVSMTFHSSKGLEFDQVILFAEDYNLKNIDDIYNHYVAATRAKDKLIIVGTPNKKSEKFVDNIDDILAGSGKELRDLLTVVK